MKLAVIGTFYGRHQNSLPLLKRLYVDSTYTPDEAWLLCETPPDALSLYHAYNVLYETEMLDRWPTGLVVAVLPTRKPVIPYSNKINWALDRTHCDTIVYLDNGSMPDPDKYKTMFVTINHRDVGAVYCGQKRTGYLDETSVADKIIDGANGVLNYTQVMHRKTADRWPLDLRYADPDIADGVFWDLLHKRLGSFHPAGSRVLDEHHMPEPKAQGI